MIPVTQPFMPPYEEYSNLISKLWETKWLTNHGVYVQELEKHLKNFLQVPTIHYVNNGTIAIQLALKALDIKGQVITTPFSFVATSSSLIWESCTPLFVDILPNTLCIDPEKIEEAITDDTEAILATHVYGIPCDIERIEYIAKKYNLKVIYDAAHAFGVKYKNKSLLSFGHISTLSFHSTKLFHTIEGGGIINNLDKEIDSRIISMRNFGQIDNKYLHVGINAKNSEFHAAMGLCNLKFVDEIIQKRKRISNFYDTYLSNKIKRPFISADIEYNYAYYPIIFETEDVLIKVMNKLAENQIQTRRYFYPSLNKLSYVGNQKSCEISEDISKRILCIPLFSELNLKEAERIVSLILEEIKI